MGFLSYLLGTGSGSSRRDSSSYQSITRADVYSTVKIPSLSAEKAQIVSDAISAKLLSNSTISLKTIGSILYQLSGDHTISEIDRKYIYNNFEKYFASKNK